MYGLEVLSNADKFLKYNYFETKDMGLHFLTLVTAVLVFSLSFAEKVFDFQHASKRKRAVVIVGWCLYMLSIIFCGLGLTLNALAGGAAVYNNEYESYANRAYLFIIFAGVCFIIGLVFTMISAIISRNSNAGITIDQ
jgi:hypothetical protein